MYYNNITDEHTKYKYRIKTEEEFIDVYGTNWRYIIQHGWNDNMNGLFGKTLKINEIDEEKIENNFTVNYYNGGWSITKQMIVELLNKPIYKPKKIKRTLENINYENNHIIKYEDYIKKNI